LNTGSKHDISRWNQEQLLDWINEHEQNRLHNLYPNQTPEESRSIENLLSYSVAVHELSSDNLPIFLMDDWERLKQLNKQKGIALIEIFNAINANSRETPVLEALVPDLLGEYYCLHYLKKSKLDNDERDFITRFAESAWEKSPLEFYSFLDRVADDYPEHPIAKILFGQPSHTENINIYAAFLFSLTYRGITERSNWAVNMLGRIYVDQPEIVLEYAKGLVNLSNAYTDLGDKEGCKKSWKGWRSNMKHSRRLSWNMRKGCLTSPMIILTSATKMAA
jgi:hypothetical protein